MNLEKKPKLNLDKKAKLNLDKPAENPSPASKAQSPGKSSNTVIIAAASIVAVGIVVAALMLKTGNEAVAPVASGDGSQSSQSDGSQTKRNDSLEVTISGVTTKQTVGTSLMTAEAGEDNVYLAVRWKYTNLTATPLDISTMPELTLVDQNGSVYESDHFANSYYSDQLKIPTRMNANPGLKIAQASVFEIGADQYKSSKWRVIVNGDDSLSFVVQ